jgi:restriction system protein
MTTELNYFDVISNSQHGKPGDFSWFPSTRVCPFCQVELTVITGNWDKPDFIDAYDNYLKTAGESLYQIKIKKCSLCGWWEIRQINYDDNNDNWSRFWQYNSILKSTNIGSLDVPIKELAKYLAKNDDKIYAIHHKKMEELVGAVLKEHFACEVIHCGQSHDRGIDILLVLGEELMPVQVKRRTKPDAMEKVSVIREMLGVMLRDERRKAMLVSTARDFTKDAKKDVKEVIEKGLVDRFDLVNYSTFMSILKSYFGNEGEDYINWLPKFLGGNGNNY